MTAVTIKTAPVFEPLLAPARYKAAWGGRGSGKSWFLASLMIEDHLASRGMRSVCIREIQKSLKESAKHLLESTIEAFGLTEKDGFKSYTDRIATPGDGVIIFQGMQDHTAESIKSLEGFDRAWVEEAQTLSARSLQLLRPTIRAPGSELHFSWNPRRKTDPVDTMFRGETVPTNSAIVRANWSDNPWFPSELEQERKDCLTTDPDQYDHIWEGGYATVTQGAYFAPALTQARRDGRIGMVAADPLMPRRAFFDIGFADSTAIWIVQFVGTELRFLDYYEASGQPLAAHLDWLRSNGHGSAEIVLPHDGSHANAVTGTRFEDHVRAAGFEARVIPNQGKGAAMRRIEVGRRLFPACRFDADKCAHGLEALGSYHERQDEKRGIGLGPEHNWASHAADAFGMACLAFETMREPVREIVQHRREMSWMAC
jgi:phage terminase large subunit